MTGYKSYPLVVDELLVRQARKTLSDRYERTFAFLKPEIISRRLVGEVLRIIENKGFRIIHFEPQFATAEKVLNHYAQHQAKPFFKDLVWSLVGNMVVPMVLEAPNAVVHLINLVGPYQVDGHVPGTLRAMFALTDRENGIHRADSLEAAKREINIWFPDQQLPS